jgi:hypothetical protein
MPFRIAQLPCDHKFSPHFSVALLERIYPRDLVCDLLTQFHLWERRERKLNQLVMVYLLIAWHLFLNESVRSVFLHLSAGLRLVGNMSMSQVPTKGAFLHRRKQLGVRLMRTLLRRVCKPLATPLTPGAFAFGYRLVAIDGTLEDVADSPANARFFGRISAGKTASPFPQARCVYLVEAATHLIFDAIVAPCHASEQRLCWGLLRSITAGMLVLLDRGFVSGAFLEALGQRGALVLARLAPDIFLTREKELGDGSYLTTLSPRSCKGLHHPLTVRVIEYWIKPEIAQVLVAQPPSRMHSNSDGTNPGAGQLHRLVTTLLDPMVYPALELCVLYHERWEIELTIDESKNHLRLSQRPLRSCLPLLALQELYALLLTHYAIRVVMLDAAQSHPQLDPDRISFILCVQALRDATILSVQTPSSLLDTVMSNLHASLVVKGSLLAPRRLRFNCRVVKRICTRFRRKRPHHLNLALPHMTFSDILLI